MFWLVFDTPSGPCVVIQPSSYMLHARITASLKHDLDVKALIEGYELDDKTVRKIPKSLVGKRLTLKEAEQLLDRLAKKRD